MKKRVLSMLLVLVMAFGLTVPTFAEEGTFETEALETDVFDAPVAPEVMDPADGADGAVSPQEASRSDSGSALKELPRIEDARETAPEETAFSDAPQTTYEIIEGTIQGTVVDAETNEPVEATVRLCAHNDTNTVLATATADADTGNFTIPLDASFAAGAYTLLFTQSLYLDRMMELERVTSSGLAIAGAVRMEPAGRAGGIVRDTKGIYPLAGVAVNVYTVDGVLKTTVTTGQDGHFSIEVRAGTYNLQLVLDGYETQTLDNIPLGAIPAFYEVKMVGGPGGGTGPTPSAPPSGDVVASGDCGAQGYNLTWAFTSDGTLTISGKGEMGDFYRWFYNDYTYVSPWHLLKVKTIVMKEGVTSISTFAFGSCYNLTSVTIPSSVTSIANEAFEYCRALTSVTIPGSVTSIGMSAFKECESLTDVTICDGVTSIGSNAFSDCDSLTRVTIPDSVTTIEKYAFWACNSLKDVYYGGSRQQWEAIQIEPGNSFITSADIHYSSTERTEEMVAGTLQAVDAQNNRVTVDGITYSIDPAFTAAMGELLTDKTTSDKRVIFKLVDGKVKSAYSIYDIFKVDVSLNNNPAITFESGQYNCSQFDINLVLRVSGCGGYTAAELKSLGDVALTLDKLHLQTASDYLYFGKTLMVKHKETTIDLSSTQLAAGRTEVVSCDVYIDTGKEPTDVTTKALIDATVDLVGGTSAFPGDTLTISIGNIDLQRIQAQTGKSNREASKTFEQMMEALGANTSIILSDDIREAISAKDKKTIEQFLSVLLAEHICAVNVGSSSFLDQVVSSAKNKLQSSILSKLGLNKAFLQSRYSKDIRQTVFVGDVEIDFYIPLTIEMAGDEAYAASALGITYTVKGTSIKGTGVFTYANFKSFTNVMMNYLKLSYSLAWGKTADQVADMFIAKPIADVVKRLGGTYSDHIFRLMKKATYNSMKKTTSKCPVDIYVYDPDGVLCVSIVDNVIRAEDASVYCYVNGDDKTVCLTEDDYYLELVGTGDGTMEYIVEEYFDNELVRTVTIQNVPLSPGKTYTGSIPEILYVDNEVYALIGDKDEVIGVDTDTYQPTEDPTPTPKPTVTPTPTPEPAVGGSFGENGSLRWNMSSDGTINVSGKGSMPDMHLSNSRTDAPWNDYKGRIKKIVIGDGITHIGNYAFFRCDAAASVMIPESVTSIGDGAFERSGLTEVTVPGSVKSIGQWAFDTCKELTSVTLEEGIISIGSDSFRDCSSLKEITFPASVEIIESIYSKSASFDYSSIEDITILNPECSLPEYYYINDKMFCSGLGDPAITTIHGYKNSTAEAHAEKFGFAFEPIGEYIPSVTPTPTPTPTPGTDLDNIQPPAGGTGWRYVPETGDYYYFYNYRRVGDYWVGFADGASKWANNWYYADADGKLLTGFQYLDDLKGGKAWYMLQVTNDRGEIGKMLTGWQWTYSDVGTGWFESKYGSQGMCTWTEKWGSYNAATGLWGDGLTHKG